MQSNHVTFETKTGIFLKLNVNYKHQNRK